MEFGKIEKFNKNKDVLDKKMSETTEEQEENFVNQDPDYGVLSKARTFETRKHLFELIKKTKQEKDKKNLLKIKGEIDEIIGNNKDK